jgi:hypothetical protein
MSDLMADMSGVNRICPAKQVNALWKGRSGGKTINLRLDKLTTCKQSRLENIEIRETTSCNLITRNHT